MTTWKEFKKEITIFSSEEMELIDSLAFLVAKRLELGISQKELAKRTGMSQSQIEKIESVDSIPSLATLKRYANGIDISKKALM